MQNDEQVSRVICASVTEGPTNVRLSEVSYQHPISTIGAYVAEGTADTEVARLEVLDLLMTVVTVSE